VLPYYLVNPAIKIIPLREGVFREIESVCGCVLTDIRGDSCRIDGSCVKVKLYQIFE